ncbi:MAG: Cys-tRNA(Pro) deacylase [Eubacteriales bacterium]
MRILDSKKIKYQSHCYIDNPSTNGVEIARILGQNPKEVFKTLVTTSKSGTNYVFVIPVENELDLKKAAKAAGEKSIEMLKSKELLPLTGYVHGGCSPIGMKKFFKTFVDSSAECNDRIIFSAGKIGYQVDMEIGELLKILEFEFVDLIV